MYDLALALGGMTVGELKWRMTFDELSGWERYVEENGPLNLGLRFDFAVARAVLPFLKQGTTLRQVMIWPKEEERDATVEDVMGFLFKARKKDG